MSTQPSSPTHSPSPIIFDGYNSSSQPSPISASSSWNAVLQGIKNSLGPLFQQILATVAGSTDPIVRQRVYKGGDRHGQTYCTIYDPVSQQRTVCASEAEVRAWLEERYYH